MRRNSLAILAGLVTAALSTHPAFAHDQAGKDHSEHASGQAQSTHQLKPVLLSKLIGSNVSTKGGENLGQVQDFVFNPQTGKIQFALVGDSFMAGGGQVVIPIPWQAISISSERQFALNVDKEKLKSAPVWGQTDSEQPDYVLRIYRFYEIPTPEEGMGSPGAGEEQSGQGQEINPGSGQQKDQGPQENQESQQAPPE